MERSKELMTLEPGAWLRRVFHEFDRLFDERGLPFFRRRPRELDDFPWMPELEIFERDRDFIVRLDLPGLKKEDISLEVNEDGLTISGERKYETEEKHHLLVHANPAELTIFSERTYPIGEPFPYRSFYWTIALPEGTRFWNAKTRFDKGVLEVTVPLPVPMVVAPVRKVSIERATDKKTTKTAA